MRFLRVITEMLDGKNLPEEMTSVTWTRTPEVEPTRQ